VISLGPKHAPTGIKGSKGVNMHKRKCRGEQLTKLPALPTCIVKCISLSPLCLVADYHPLGVFCAFQLYLSTCILALLRLSELEIHNIFRLNTFLFRDIPKPCLNPLSRFECVLQALQNPISSDKNRVLDDVDDSIV
jgi:hypothetical protein